MLFGVEELFDDSPFNKFLIFGCAAAPNYSDEIGSYW